MKSIFSGSDCKGRVSFCTKENKTSKAPADSLLHEVLSNVDLQEALSEWETKRSRNAVFLSVMNDLHCVGILLFVAASRNADLNLHLQAGHALSKLFFAMDLKYMCDKGGYPFYITLEWTMLVNN